MYPHHFLPLHGRFANTSPRDRNDPTYRAALIAEYGDLGVLDVPEGRIESEVRHCREHLRFRDHNFPPEFAARVQEEKELGLWG